MADLRIEPQKTRGKYANRAARVSQRKFSANHTKSAYFQRKFSANQTFSVKVSVNFHFTLLYFVPRPTPSGCKMPSLHIWCRI